MDATPGNLWEFLMTFDASMRFPLIIVSIVFGTILLVIVAGIIAGTVNSMHKHRLDDALKRELVDRGMSAEEIERIVRVRSGTTSKPVAVHVNQQYGEEQ
jgi:signal transduction histidine kinase